MKVLIVTPDFKEVVVAGFGGFFYKIYQKLLILQLKVLIRRFPTATILTSNSLSDAGLFYDDLILKINYYKLRKTVWKFVRGYFKNDFKWDGISINRISETRSAIHFSLIVFSYVEVLNNLISELKPDLIYTLTADSIPEKVAQKLGADLKIKTKTFFKPNISLLEKLVDYFLRLREAKLRFLEVLKIAQEKRNFSKIPQKGILIEASHPLQLKSALPLISNAKDSFLITHIPNIKPELEKLTKEKINFLQAASFLTGEEAKKIYKSARSKAKIWWAKVKNQNQSFLFELSKEHLGNTALYYFPLAAIFVEAAKKIIQTTKPKAVVVFSDRGFIDGAIAKVSGKFKIPSFLVSPNTNMSVDKTNNYDICDFVTVPGEHLRQELIKIGHKKDDIFVVGDLRFDNLPKILKSFNKKKICQKIGIDLNKKIVLLISFHLSGLISAEEKRALFQSTSSVVNKISEAQLVIRPHPNEPISDLKAEVGNWGIKNAKIDSNSSLHELLFISDLVVMAWSMTGFEAMIFEKPVVTCNFFGKDYDQYIPYVSKGAAIEAKTEQELEETVKTLLFDKLAMQKLITQAKKFVEYYLGRVDGKVAKRIINIINQ